MNELDAARAALVNVGKERSEILSKNAKLQDEVKELNELLKAARKGQPLGPIIGAQTIAQQENMLRELRAENAKLWEYVQHLNRCVSRRLSGESCDCGLDDLLKDAAEPADNTDWECPCCRASIEPDATYCHQCGAALESK